jgi:hypothetical protein
MSFSITVGSDQTAYLINATGDVLWTFPNVESARKTCQDWYATPEVVMEQSPTNHLSECSVEPFSRCVVSPSSHFVVGARCL